MRRERRFGLPAFGLILTCGLVFLSVALLTSGAQKRMLLMGGARGVVHNAAGEPLEGIGVQLISAKTAIRTTVYTNVDGKYEFPVLAAGDYTLRVALPREYQPFVKDSIRIEGAKQLDEIVLQRVSNTEFLPPTPEELGQLTDLPQF